jgi:hypothetical protein
MVNPSWLAATFVRLDCPTIAWSLGGDLMRGGVAGREGLAMFVVWTLFPSNGVPLLSSSGRPRGGRACCVTADLEGGTQWIW